MDIHEGKGGSYITDPKSGKRTLAHRTLSQEEHAAGQRAEAAKIKNNVGSSTKTVMQGDSV